MGNDSGANVWDEEGDEVERSEPENALDDGNHARLDCKLLVF